VDGDLGHSHRLSKKLHSLLDVMAQKLRPRTHGQAAVHRFCTPMAPPQVTQEGEIIEFLAQIPSDTMIFITTAALGLAATLIGLRWLI
jgi:hypothetical protein